MNNEQKNKFLDRLENLAFDVIATANKARDVDLKNAERAVISTVSTARYILKAALIDRQAGKIDLQEFEEIETTLVEIIAAHNAYQEGLQTVRDCCANIISNQQRLTNVIAEQQNRLLSTEEETCKAN